MRRARQAAPAAFAVSLCVSLCFKNNECHPGSSSQGFKSEVRYILTAIKILPVFLCYSVLLRHFSSKALVSSNSFSFQATMQNGHYSSKINRVGKEMLSGPVALAKIPQGV